MRSKVWVDLTLQVVVGILLSVLPPMVALG